MSASRRNRKLTATEQRVADLLARGCTNAEIAGELQLSLATVKMHVHDIFEVLGVSNRAKAAVVLIQRRTDY